MSPLLYAARDGYLDIADLLIGAGADIEQAEANNISPLLMTLINGHMPLANLLLDQGLMLTVTISGAGRPYGQRSNIGMST